MKKNPSHILVVTLSNLGDVIMTTPVIMRLKEEFPDANISVVVGPKAQGVLKPSQNIHEVIVYDKRASFVDKKEFIKRLRKIDWGWVVDLRHSAIPYLVKSKKRTPLLRRYRKKMKREAHLEVLEWMGLQRKATQPFDFFQKSDEKSMLEKLKSLGVEDCRDWIVVAPGAASERKRWAAKKFRHLIEKISAETGKTILLAGSPEEREIAERVAKGSQCQVVMVTGVTNLAESAAMLARAALVVANDSAMMHLGFELQVPTVGIFGPTEHKQYGHVGDQFRIAYQDAKICGCNDYTKPKAERSCFHGLDVDHVHVLCQELLGKKQ